MLYYKDQVSGDRGPAAVEVGQGVPDAGETPVEVGEDEMAELADSMDIAEPGVVVAS